MKAISQLVISIFELMEAEGRDLRKVVRAEARDFQSVIVQLALSVAILLVSIPLLTVGIWLLGAGLMWWLETQVARPLAAAMTGLVIFACGVVCLLLFRSLSRRRLQ